eukprot:6492779-Amphidinium_carterae.7
MAARAPVLAITLLVGFAMVLCKLVRMPTRFTVTFVWPLGVLGTEWLSGRGFAVRRVVKVWDGVVPRPLVKLLSVLLSSYLRRLTMYREMPGTRGATCVLLLRLPSL